MDRYKKHPDESLIYDVFQACADWHDNGCGFGATSSVQGTGAVEDAEKRFSAMHANRPALLTASATYGIRGALLAAGVKPGDVVLIPGYDWPASFEAVLSIGAEPRFVPVDPGTMTLDPEAVSGPGLAGVKAVCVTHIYGVAADIPGLRERVGDSIAIIEDCAQALGSSIDGRFTGTLDSDYAVFSFGPGKQIDAGEGGMILSKDWDAYERVLRETQHPVRQLRDGGEGEVNYRGFSVRPHPLTAILLLYKMDRYGAIQRQADFRQLAEKLARAECCRPIGTDERRENAQERVPVFLDPERGSPGESYTYVRSGAFNLTTMKQSGEAVMLVGKAG